MPQPSIGFRSSIWKWLLPLVFVSLLYLHAQWRSLPTIRTNNNNEYDVHLPTPQHAIRTPIYGDDYDDMEEPYTSTSALSIERPVLTKEDLIYQADRWGNPIVIFEYKLLFFTIPKVACTEWKLLFRKMSGYGDWDASVPLKALHNPSTNNLTHLADLPLDIAQQMLTSPQWTRAVIVREPKERVLSAFLNKFLNDAYFFYWRCCQFRDNATQHDCQVAKEKRNFTYFLHRTRDCPNDHWDPQYYAIDSKWWNTMTFVGYMNDQIATTAKQLLQSLTSQLTRKTAWEEFGSNGWGPNGTLAFMERDSAHHATNAHDHLKEYYTKENEVFVEQHWAIEWNQSVYEFEPFHLYP